MLFIDFVPGSADDVQCEARILSAFHGRKKGP